MLLTGGKRSGTLVLAKGRYAFDQTFVVFPKHPIEQRG